MPEQVEVQQVERDATAAQVNNLSSLTNDQFLNADLGIEVKKPEVKVEEVTETIPVEDVKLETEVVEEKPIEEIADEVKEEKPEEVEGFLKIEEIKLEEAPIQLNETEPEEGTWAFIAKQDGLSLKEESYEAFKEAITQPLVEQLEAIKVQKMDEFLAEIDPKIRLRVELNLSGMSNEDIDRPYEVAREFKSMEPQALVREDLKSRFPQASEEWLDKEMERLVSTDGIEHERERIIMEVDAHLDIINNEREERLKQYNINKQSFLNEQKVKEIESVSNALNNMSMFMGKTIPEHIRKGLSTSYTKGQYNNLLNDSQAKAEFIAWKQIGSQLLKNIEAESFNKGLEKVSKKLHNTPPVETGGAGKSTTTEIKGNFDKLKNDPNLKY